MFRLIIICILISGIGKVYSQNGLDQLLEGKTNFNEIMQVVDAYYAEHPEDENEVESDYLHWKRWEWFMSGRLGSNGELVNISEKLWRGLAEKERIKQFPEERNVNSGWTFIGPTTTPLQNPGADGNGLGRVDRIIFHPTDQNIIYICTPNGGLWNTLNGGITWNNLTDNLPCIGFSGFVISYANTNIMYLLTGDGDTFSNNGFGFVRPSQGVFKSIDGGNSWHQTGTLPNTGNSYAGFNLIQSPADPELLFAATNVGLYRTTNGGTSWTKEEEGKFWDVKFKPGDATRVYATKKGAFMISTDSGDTWTSNSTYDINPNTCGSNGGERTLIAVSPSLPVVVYLLAAPRISAGVFCGVYISIDNGATFTRQSTTPNIFGSSDDGSDDYDQSNYDLAFACRPDLVNTIIAGAATVWRSTNAGNNWIHSTSYNPGNGFPYIHPDVHHLAYNPLNNYLYAATDGGFYRSTDHGVTWTDLTVGIKTSMFYHMAGWDGNINKLIGGLQDNGLKYRKDNTTAFYHMGCCDGFDVVFNPVNGEPGYGTVNNSAVRYSSNGAASNWFNPDTNTQWFKTLAIHNTDTNIVLIGAGLSIYRTTNGGASWNVEGATGSWALTSCPSNNSRFYASGGGNFGFGDGGLYFSGNTGDTWTIKSTTPGFPDDALWNKITDVAVRPTNSAEVYASFGGFTDGVKVFKSTNTGDSWTNLSDNLPNVPINCLAIDNNNGVYAGTDIGVFYRGPSMTDWMTWSNGLPNVPVTELIIFDDGVNKKIRAATYGRGVWESNLAQTCDAAVIVTGNLEGIRHYEANTSVTSTSIVQGGIGTFVSFQSGDYITLTENFMVIDDSEFLGFISPCGQGGIPSVNGNDIINRADPNSSIILLRRMWDPETELPYGFIHNIEWSDGMAEIDYEINKPGKVEIVAARQIQEKLFVLQSRDEKKGRRNVKVDISNLPKEFHYLLLFYEGKLVHFQEMDLRPPAP